MRGQSIMTAGVLDIFLELSPAATFLRDDNGVYLWVNRAFAQLYGVDDPTGMVGHDVFSFDPPAVAAQHLESDRRVLHSGVPEHRTVHLSHSGVYREAAGSHFRVALPEERKGVGGIYSDVTELGQTRDALQQAQVRISSLFERSSVALAVVAVNGTVREANAALCRLLGRDSSEMVGNALEALAGQEVNALLTAARGGRSARATVLVPLPGGLTRLAIATMAPEADRLTHVLALQPITSVPSTLRRPLSARDSRLLELIARGEDNASIAEQLHLSRQGLDYHIRRLRDRLRAGNRVELVSRAYAIGVLDLSTWPPAVTRPNSAQHAAYPASR